MTSRTDRSIPELFSEGLLPKNPLDRWGVLSTSGRKVELRFQLIKRFQ